MSLEMKSEMSGIPNWYFNMFKTLRPCQGMEQMPNLDFGSTRKRISLNTSNTFGLRFRAISNLAITHLTKILASSFSQLIILAEIREFLNPSRFWKWVEVHMVIFLREKWKFRTSIYHLIFTWKLRKIFLSIPITFTLVHLQVCKSTIATSILQNSISRNFCRC